MYAIRSYYDVWADLTLIEVLDPNTGEPVGPGEKGELVVTMLQKEALPIVRYRTGDITTLDEEVCACGRTHPRIGRIRITSYNVCYTKLLRHRDIGSGTLVAAHAGPHL